MDDNKSVDDKSGYVNGLQEYDLLPADYRGFFDYGVPHGPVLHLQLTKAGIKKLKKGTDLVNLCVVWI